MIKISVIIPTWNRADLISRAISSALKQDYYIHEILVCDDGSTDNTSEVLKALIKKEKKIKYLYQKHIGSPAITRNLGIKNSTGDYIAFLDSDDYWTSKKLSSQIQTLKSTGLKICATSMLTQDERVQRVNYQILHDTNLIICSSLIAEKSLLIKAGLFPEPIEYISYEDWLLWMRISTITDIAITNEPLVHYNNLSSDSVRQKQVEWNSIKKKLETDILKWGISNFLKHPNKSRLFKAMIYSLKESL